MKFILCVFYQSSTLKIDNVVEESDDDDDIVAPKLKKRRTLEFSDDEDKSTGNETPVESPAGLACSMLLFILHTAE